MEKIKRVPVKDTKVFHEFYCDNCNEFLMKSYELDDGYYEHPKSYILRCYSDNIGWLILTGNYCEKCMKEKEEKVINFLKENGFVEG